MPRKRKVVIDDVVLPKDTESVNADSGPSNCKEEDEYDTDEDLISNRLTESMKKELGEVNLNWFEDAVNESNARMQPVPQKETIQGSPTVNLHSSKSDGPPSTPNLESPNLQPLGFGSSPVIHGSDRLRKNWTHSTPADVTLSLGATMGGHDLSWTSSMETPIVSSSIASNRIQENEKLKVAPSAPTADLCDTPDKSLVIGGALKLRSEEPLKFQPVVAAVEQEFKIPSDRLKHAETNSEASHAVIAAKNSLKEDQSSDACHVADCSTTPKKPKRRLSRVSLPRRRMADMCLQKTAKDANLVTLKSSPKEGEHSVKVQSVSISLEAKSELELQTSGAKQDKECQISTEDLVCNIKKCTESPPKVQEDENMEQHLAESSVGSMEPSTKVLKECDVVLAEESQNAIFNFFEADHDYALSSVLKPTVDDSIDKGNIHMLSNDSELMEIVDCTTACLESIREDYCFLKRSLCAASDHDVQIERSDKEASDKKASVLNPVTSAKPWQVLEPIDEPIDNVNSNPGLDDIEVKSEVKLRDHLLETAILAKNKEHLQRVTAESKDSTVSKSVATDVADINTVNGCPLLNSIMDVCLKTVQELVLATEDAVIIADEAPTEAESPLLMLQAAMGTNECNLTLEKDLLLIAEDNSKSVATATVEQGLKNKVSSPKHFSTMESLHFFPAARPSSMPGFSMVSGKAVQISKKAIEEAERFFQEDLSLFCMKESPCPDVSLSLDALGASCGKAKHEGFQGFQGFLTASGKPVTVSDAALKQAKRLHMELEKDMDQGSVSAPSMKDIRGKQFQGFSTASGKACAVSEEALKKARQVYESLLEDAAAKNDLPSERCLGDEDHGDGRGIKRIFSNAIVQQPPKKVNSQAEDGADGRESDKSASAPSPEVANAMDVSEDSLDAAQALIAMFNASWNDPPVEPCAEFFPEAPKDLSVLAGVVEAKDKGNLDASAHNMSVEVLESTFAFLEDELQGDISKTGDSFLKFESPSVKSITTQSELTVLNTSLGTPKLLRTHLAKCKGMLPEGGDSSKNNGCDPAIVQDGGIQSLMGELTSDGLSRRRAVIEEQLKRIAEKSKLNTVPPSMGALYKAKTSGKHSRVTLRQFFTGLPRSLPFTEALKLGVKESTLNVRSRNAEEFRFSSDEHFRGLSADSCGILKLASGTANLILDEQNSAGKEEFYKALVDCPGVDPKLVSQEWVSNHYRWIVWKLAAMETSFPQKCGGRCLTPARVLSELRYRVNCEIDCSRRSSLKKITERDDIPMKTMVLCVADIVRPDSEMLAQSDNDLSTDASTKNSILLELTDGWYSMKATMDKPLTYLVERGEISVGQKLVVHGMEIVGSLEACPPLEVKSNQFLKLSYNCCRRAKWDTKLGYLQCPRPFPLPLNSFRSDGGLIGRVDIVIARVYPLQYLEKRSDGSSFVCNAKMNAIADKRAEIQKCALMDRLYDDALSKLEQDDVPSAQRRHVSTAQNLSAEQMKSLTSGEELSEALQNAADPVLFESCLSSTQKQSLVGYHLTADETKQARLQVQLSKFMQAKLENGEFPVERDVVPFLKVRVAGVHPKDVCEKTTSLMTLWRPSENINSYLMEGKCMRIYYLMAERRSNGRELLMKSTKLTKFEEKCNVPNDVVHTVYKPRQFTLFDDIMSSGFQPLYGEVDIIGVVLNTSQPQRGKFEVVYLANTNHDIVGVKFWGGLKAFGVEAVLEPASFVVGCNLQWRGHERSPIPYVYMLEISTFTRNPKGDQVQRLVSDLRGAIKDVNGFLDKAKEKITSVLNSSSSAPSASPLLRPGQPKFVSTPKANWRPPYRSATPTSSEESVLARSASNSDKGTAAQSQAELTLRKMRRLQHVGAPPPLSALGSPLASSVSSKCKVPFSKPGPSSSK